MINESSSGSEVVARVEFLKTNRDAIGPVGLLVHVVRGRLDLDRHHAAGLHHPLQQGVMVLQKKTEELLLVSPLELVIVLDGIGSVGRALGRRA